MPVYVRIIVEQQGGQWTAWFQDVPQTGCGGEYPSTAIERLLERYGPSQFIADGIVSDHEASTEDHLEFLIPLTGRQRIPSPSAN